MISGFNGEYRWLSNFWKVDILYEGLVYPTVENAYQAAKVEDFEIKKSFVNINPFQAKKLGKQIELREGFDSVKINIMTNLTRLKYENKVLRELLLNTGEEEIVEENTWNDTFWGVCNGKGSNNLGKIIMNVRQEIKFLEYINNQ